jgi:8-oxo-(d)GTP phosphatase
VLAAYAPTRVVTSGSTRCVDTVRPFARRAGLCPECDDGLSQEDATPATVRAVVAGMVAGDEDALLCSHRPVLPLVLEALGLPDQGLATGELLVAHVRRGAVVATERHRPAAG